MHPKTCKLCPAGRASETTGVVWFGNQQRTGKLCSICGTGFYQNEVGQQSFCKSCPDGWANWVQEYAIQCMQATPGKYASEDHRKLEPCPLGRYQNEWRGQGIDSCKYCPTGYESEAESIECVACLAGKVSGLQRNCQTCAAGTFQNENSAKWIGAEHLDDIPWEDVMCVDSSSTDVCSWTGTPPTYADAVVDARCVLNTKDCRCKNRLVTKPLFGPDLSIYESSPRDQIWELYFDDSGTKHEDGSQGARQNNIPECYAWCTSDDQCADGLVCHQRDAAGCEDCAIPLADPSGRCVLTGMGLGWRNDYDFCVQPVITNVDGCRERCIKTEGCKSISYGQGFHGESDQCWLFGHACDYFAGYDLEVEDTNSDWKSYKIDIENIEYKCKLCEPGKYQADAGSSSCTSCPAGYTSNKLTEYVVVASGTCGAQGFGQITTFEQCEAAATALGLVETFGDGANSITQDNRAPECIWSPVHKNLMFNTDSNSIACGSNNFDCICTNNGYGRSVCDACIPGKFSSSSTQLSDGCGNCAASYYQPAPAQNGCPKCPHGWYTPATSYWTSCVSVGTGHYANDAQTGPAPCPKGKYQNEMAQQGLASCKQCPGGRTTNGADKQTSCTLCPVGYYASDHGSMENGCKFAGINTADPQTFGYYADHTGQTWPKNCPDGSGVNAERTTCTACPEGKASVLTTDPVRKSCETCQAGTYTDDACLECPDGQYSTSEETVCKDCVPGFYTNAPSWKALYDPHRAEDFKYCQPCSSGAYQDEAGQATCTACEAGKYNKYKSVSSCTDCAVGKYQNEEGRRSCKFCAPGTSSAAASSTCQDCATGKTEGILGDCETCAAGTYQDEEGTAWRQVVPRLTPAGNYVDGRRDVSDPANSALAYVRDTIAGCIEACFDKMQEDSGYDGMDYSVDFTTGNNCYCVNIQKTYTLIASGKSCTSYTRPAGPYANGYAHFLDPSDPMADTDRAQECANRCEAEGHSYFYLWARSELYPHIINRCMCGKDSCASSHTPYNDYDTYAIEPLTQLGEGFKQYQLVANYPVITGTTRTGCPAQTYTFADFHGKSGDWWVGDGSDQRQLPLTGGFSYEEFDEYCTNVRTKPVNGPHGDYHGSAHDWYFTDTGGRHDDGNSGAKQNNIPECQGDCDSDAQCADGLVCFHRESSDGTDPVPSCDGAARGSAADYCVSEFVLRNVDLDTCKQRCDDDEGCSAFRWKPDGDNNCQIASDGCDARQADYVIYSTGTCESRGDVQISSLAECQAAAAALGRTIGYNTLYASGARPRCFTYDSTPTGLHYNQAENVLETGDLQDIAGGIVCSKRDWKFYVLKFDDYTFPCRKYSPSTGSYIGTWSTYQAQMGFRDVTYSYQCKACQAGDYQNEAGKTFCKACPACQASYVRGSGTGAVGCSNTCVACGAGKYSDELAPTGSSVCKDCGMGKYSSLWLNVECKLCPGGWHNPSTGAVECTFCGAGRYSGIGWGICYNCAAGYYSDQVGQTSVNTCVSCAPGKYQDKTGQISCESCPAGKYNDQVGQTSSSTCVSCGPGKYAVSDASSFCAVCAAGRYSARWGQASSSTCEACPAGTYSSTTGATISSQCQACATGRYSNQGQGQTSTTVCKICAAGRYQNQMGSTVCKNCAAGYYSNQGQGQTSVNTCVSCAPGKYQDISGSTVCKNCAAGRYSGRLSQASSSTCEACPAGTYSSTGGATSSSQCAACAVGRHASAGATTCVDCAIGKYQLNGNRAECDQECSASEIMMYDYNAQTCVACTQSTCGCDPGYHEKSVADVSQTQYSEATGYFCGGYVMPSPLIDNNYPVLIYNSLYMPYYKDELFRKFTGDLWIPPFSDSANPLYLEDKAKECFQRCAHDHAKQFKPYTDQDDRYVAGVSHFMVDGNNNCMCVQQEGCDARTTSVLDFYGKNGALTSVTTYEVTSTVYTDTCVACGAVGKYQDQVKQTTCKECPTGRYTFLDYGAVECKLCPAGFYNNLDPSEYYGFHCLACDDGTGKYQDQAGQTSCKTCPAGQSSLCTDCGSGNHDKHAGSTTCQ